MFSMTTDATRIALKLRSKSPVLTSVSYPIADMDLSAGDFCTRLAMFSHLSMDNESLMKKRILEILRSEPRRSFRPSYSCWKKVIKKEIEPGNYLEASSKSLNYFDSCNKVESFSDMPLDDSVEVVQCDEFERAMKELVRVAYDSALKKIFLFEF